MERPYSMIETLRDFVEKADLLDIDYMVTGSFAMSSYGEIRMTRDIDVVVQISEMHVAPFTELFISEYYVNESSIRRAIENRTMFNVINQRFGGKIDCIVSKDSEFARMSFSRRRLAAVSGVKFWTSTKEDLILAKLNWARDTHSEMQIRDIANLTSNEYDSIYTLGWINRLGLESIWHEVQEWKIQQSKIDS